MSTIPTIEIGRAAEEYLPKDDEGNEEAPCDHARMADPTGAQAGMCTECSEACSCVAGDPSEVDSTSCPIHGT